MLTGAGVQQESRCRGNDHTSGMPPPAQTQRLRCANEVWAYDIAFAACADGQQLKCLSIVNEIT
jgi:hypothetical protein